MNKGIKLKVWTRRYKGLRGVCVGYLIAFDKHMNLVRIFKDIDTCMNVMFHCIKTNLTIIRGLPINPNYNEVTWQKKPEKEPT